MLYLEGTDVIGHLFAAECRRAWAACRTRTSRATSGTVDEYYALVDRLLGQWMRRAAGGRRDAHRQLGPRLQVGRRPVLRARVAEPGHGRVLAPARRGLRRLGRARADEPRARARRASSTSSRRWRRCSACPSIAGRAGAPIRAGVPRPRRRRRAKDLVAEVPVRRLAAEQMSEKEASEYAKKLMALGYLSGSEPGKLAPTGGDRPGMTEGAWNNLGLYLCATSGARPTWPRRERRLREGDGAAARLRVAEAQSRGAPARPRRGPAGDRRALPGHRRRAAEIRSACCSTGRSPTT